MDDNINVKREKSDVMEHNAPANSPPGNHEEVIRHMDLAADIREALPHLDPAYLNPTLRVVMDAGPAEPADLQFLREEDFRAMLSPLQCRRLVYYFTNKYRGGVVPSPENGRNRDRDRVSSSARTEHCRKKARMEPHQDGFVSNAEGPRQREGPLDRSTFSDEGLASEATAKTIAVGDSRVADGADSSLRVADSSKLCYYSPQNEAGVLDENSAAKESVMASDSSEKNSSPSQGFVASAAPLLREGAAGDECKTGSAAAASAPPTRGFQSVHHPGKSKFGHGRGSGASVEGRINLMSNRINNLQKTVEHIRSVCEYTNLIVTEMSGVVPRPESLPEEQLQPSPSCTFSFAPASTLEELDEILNNEEIVPYLKTCERDTLAGTLRTMLKTMLTRELAVQFSFTGLGAKRQRTKYSLKNHKLYRIFQQGVRATRHKSANLSEMDVVLKNVLKNALDWDGHRGHRRNQETQQSLDPSRLCELSVGGQEASGHEYSSYAAQQWAAGGMEGGLNSLSSQERWNLSE